jgi:hypothetical protein
VRHRAKKCFHEVRATRVFQLSLPLFHRIHVESTCF